MGEQNYALELYMRQHAVTDIDEMEDEDKKIKQQVGRAGVFYPSVLRAVQRLQGMKKCSRAVESLAAEARKRQQVWTERCDRLRAEFSSKGLEASLEEAGWFYYRAKDYDRAVAKLERALLQTPAAETYCRLGQAKAKLGDLEGAIEAWETGLRLDATRADI